MTLKHVWQQLACSDKRALVRKKLHHYISLLRLNLEFECGDNSLMNPLMPSDSISMYTSSLLYVSTSAGARAMLDLVWANFITRVAILWIRLTGQMGVSKSRRQLNNSNCVGPIPSRIYLIFACTVSESSRFIGSGVTAADAIQLVPGRLILIVPFP